MRLTGTRLILTATLAVAACGPQPAPRIPRATAVATTGSAASPRPSPTPTDTRQVLAPGPADVHAVNWAGVPLPGDFCGVRGTRTIGRQTRATSRQWGTVFLVRDKRVTYGDVDGDGRPEAGVGLECTNGSGTADGQLAFASIVVTSAGGRLEVLGTVTPRQNPPNVHVSFFTKVRLTPGRVQADEQWYRDTDPTCCPSGTATTVWTLRDGRLSPGPPDITS